MALAHPSLDQMRGELHVGEEFLAKYNRPGPRYTSYPTAPVWNDTFGPADLEKVHAEAELARTPVSLYMHIPFCESLCLFCACNVVIQKNKSVAPPYLDVLKQEMKRISRSVSKNRPVVQFHWGGGPPTYLTPEQIEDLFGCKVGRSAAAPVELDYGAILGDAAADAFHFLFQDVKIRRGDTFVFLDDDVAGAKKTEAFAKGNVHVERNGCAGALGFIVHTLEISGPEGIVPDRRRGIAGIARPGAIVFGEEFFADMKLAAHLLQA